MNIGYGPVWGFWGKVGLWACILAIPAIPTAGLFYYKHKANVAVEQAQEAISEGEKTKQLLDSKEHQLRWFIKAHEKIRHLYELRGREIEKLESAKKAQNAQIKQGLQDNPDWANTPIPDSVRDILNGKGTD